MRRLWAIIFAIGAKRTEYRPTTITDYPYGNEGHDPYRTQKCVKISKTMPICNEMAYKDMWLPNFMEHETIKEVEGQLQYWLRLVQRGCHAELAKFLCSLYTPVCLQNHNKDKNTPQDMLTTMIPPCQQLCIDCSPVMEQAGYSWPDSMNCTTFPDIKKTRLCVPPSTEASPAPKAQECSGYCLFSPETKIEGHLLKEQFCREDVVFTAKIKSFKTGKRYGKNVLIQFNNKSLKLMRSGQTKSELQKSQFGLLDARECYDNGKCADMKKARRRTVLVMANQVETKSRHRGRKTKQMWTITHLSKMPKKAKDQEKIRKLLTLDDCCNAGANSCQN